MLYLTVYEMKCFDKTKQFHCYFIRITKLKAPDRCAQLLNVKVP